MKKIPFLLLMTALFTFLLLLNACPPDPPGTSDTEDELNNSGDSSVPDTTPPVPGSLAVESVGLESIMLGWTASSDETTAASSLRYRLYYSAADNISSVSDAELNGTAVGSAYSTSRTATATGLSQTTVYWFMVIVQDEAGNKSGYSTVSQGTRISTVEQNSSAGADERITAIVAEGPYLYIAGWRYTSDNSDDWRIEKRDLATGSLVTAFSDDGIIESDWTASDRPDSIAVSGNYLIVSGWDNTQSRSQWRTEIFNKTTGASIMGKANLVSLNNDVLKDIVTDGDSIFLAGSQNNNYAVRLEKRSLTDLSYVTDFNVSGPGYYTEDLSGSMSYYSYYNAVAVDANWVYAAGTTSDGDDYLIDKFDKITGTPDPDFGTSGRLIFDPIDVSGNELFSIEALDGYIYAIGAQFGSTSWDYLEIYKISIEDGSFDTFFGGGGDKRIVNPSGYNLLWENPTFIDGEDLFTASGLNNNEAGVNPQWYIEKRSISSGELDAFFGSSGIISEDLSTATSNYEECAHAIFVDGLNVYTGGTMYLESDGSYEWYLKIYDRLTGD